MTRRTHYGHSEPVDICHRPRTSYPASVSTSTRETARPYQLNFHSNRMSPAQEPDPEKGASQARRRITVACSRCRKRKIKCSGDPGNGQGCTGCRNAGTEPGHCQFLRVNSINTICATPPGSEWPYESLGPSSASAGMSHMSGSLDQYSSPLSSQGSSSFTGSNGSTTMHPASGYSNVAYATTSGRPEYCANYNPALQDYSFDPLSVSGSNFSMSNHDHASISSYASQDFTRHWPPTSSNKSMPNGVLFDQEGQPKYNHSTLPYLNSSVGTVSATLDGPPFPGMGSLATSLPNPVLKSSRVLPNPAANPVLSNPNGATGAHQGVMGDPSPLWSQPSGLKSTAPWGPESMGSQGSSSSSSSSTLTGSGGNKSSTPSSDAHENTFGYTIPLTQSPSSTISATTSEYNVGDSSTPGSVEEHLASDASIYPHGLSGGSLLGSHDASTNLYGYGAVGSTKRGSVAEASGTLLSSGRLYKHLPQSQHQQIGSLSMEHRDSLDPSSRNTVRKSISSVSNSRRY